VGFIDEVVAEGKLGVNILSTTALGENLGIGTGDNQCEAAISLGT